MKPAARKDALLVEELPDETLVYDTKSHKAFCLNKTTAAVWQKCDGSASIEQISNRVCAELGIDWEKDPDAGTDLVNLALDRLAKARLLSDPTRPALPALRYSRRELSARLASIGGAALIPIVLTITAPTAAAAATCISPRLCNTSLAYLGRCCCGHRRICIQQNEKKGTCQGAKC